VEYFPAPQSIQLLLPALVLYFPATQAVHGPPFAPVYPALHKHVELPAADCEFWTQFWQTVELVAPVTSE